VSLPTPQPRIAQFNISGASFVIVGSNGVPAWPYYIIASTNILLPLANWTRIGTNQFDSAGNFFHAGYVDPTSPQQFYLLEIE
jgi:hypothetical protein